MAFERPCLVFADTNGNIYDEPELYMLSRSNSELSLPRPDEVTPLPDGWPIVLLPSRQPLGLDPETGEAVIVEELAAAALLPANYIASGLPAYHMTDKHTAIPEGAYAALGLAHDKLYVCAKKITDDTPHRKPKASSGSLKKSAATLKSTYLENRLIAALADALPSSSPFIKNFFLGQGEILLPFAPTKESSPSPSAILPQSLPQIFFTPSATEISEVLSHHMNTAIRPVVTFVAPPNTLATPELFTPLIEAIGQYRQQGGTYPITLQTETLVSTVIPLLKEAGLTSITLTIPAAYPSLYDALNEINNWSFAHMASLIKEVQTASLPFTLRYAYIPGISDTEKELDSLINLIHTYTLTTLWLYSPSCNLERTYGKVQTIELGPIVGIGNFCKRLKKQPKSITLLSATPSS